MELEPYVPKVNTTDNWTLVHQGPIYGFDYNKNQVDWFLKIEDWSFVAVENLRYMLQHFPQLSSFFLAMNSNFQALTIIVETLRRFTTEAKKPYTPNCLLIKGYTEDTGIRRCLMNVGVTTVGSRDEFSYETFLPVVNGYVYMPLLKNSVGIQKIGYV